MSGWTCLRSLHVKPLPKRAGVKTIKRRPNILSGVMFVRKAPACTAKPLSALQCSQVLPKAQKESKSQRVSHRARILHNQHIDGSRPQLCTALTLQIRSEQGEHGRTPSDDFIGPLVQLDPIGQNGFNLSLSILSLIILSSNSIFSLLGFVSSKRTMSLPWQWWTWVTWVIQVGPLSRHAMACHKMCQAFKIYSSSNAGPDHKDGKNSTGQNESKCEQHLIGPDRDGLQNPTKELYFCSLLFIWM